MVKELLEKAFFLRFAALLLVTGAGKLTEEFFLLFGEVGGRENLKNDGHVASAMPAKAGDTLGLQRLLVVGLRPFGDGDGLCAMDGWDIDLVPQGCLHHGDRQGVIDIFAISFKDFVRIDLEKDIQITGMAAFSAALAFALQTHPRTSINTCRYLERHLFLFVHQALAATILAGIGDDFTRSLALRAGGAESKESLGAHHLTTAIAARTGLALIARTEAGPFAGPTGLGFGDLDLFANPVHRLHERERQVITEVGPRHRTLLLSGTATPTTKPEKVFKDIAKA